MERGEVTSDGLTEAERARILRNRQMAERLLSSQVIRDDQAMNVVVRRSKAAPIDVCNGGFIPDCERVTEKHYFEKDEELTDIDSDDPNANRCLTKRRRRRAVCRKGHPTNTDAIDSLPVPIPPDQAKPECDLCYRIFDDSFLLRNFDVSVCDRCRDPKGIHTLVTKSTAKERYLLNDVDLDVREPKLRFILKRNPHNSNWGDMRLYLEAQIAERSLCIWGSEEALESERERRLQQNESTKLKRYNKKLKELKVQTRSSLFMKTHTTHEHNFGSESYDEENDVYVKRCTTCNFVSSYEKL